MEVSKTVNDIEKWIKDKVEEAGASGVVYGLSGGIDSAVTAAIVNRIFKGNALGVIMPCHSIDKDEQDARLLEKYLGLKVEKVDLTSTFDEFIKNIDVTDNNELALSNIKPRLRMTTLYYYAQKNNYLVLGSTNKSEFYTGYFTKYGDSSVDLLPLADFVKSEIYMIAKYLSIPNEIIDKAPSAGLTTNQTDEEEMGVTYDELDNYIKTGIADNEISKKLSKMNTNTSHKRNYPPIFKQI